MYIGHYAVAAALVTLVPASPVTPIAVGVAWPDLVWPVLVFIGREHVTVNRSDPLQRSIRFDSYPFSHSLVLSNVFTLVPAVIVAFLYDSVLLGVLFWVATLSHWVLDLVVHLPDLPVLGFGGNDRMLGFRALAVSENSLRHRVRLLRYRRAPHRSTGGVCRCAQRGSRPAPPEREFVLRVQQTEPVQHANPLSAHHPRGVCRRDCLVHTCLEMIDKGFDISPADPRPPSAILMT